MKRELALKLMALHDTGKYNISVSTVYVDSPVYRIWEDDTGNVVYESQVYTGRSLVFGVSECEVSVAKIIQNWQILEV